MRLALCNKMLDDRPIEAFFELAATAGFGAVELMPGSLGTPVSDPDPAMRVQVLQVARAHGLDIVGFNSLLQHAPHLNLVTRDPALRRASAAELVAIVQLAAHFGASVIVVGSPRQRRAPDDATFDESANLFIDELRPAADEAARLDITLCLEPLVASLTNFMNDTREGIAVARRMNHPAVKLVLDVKQISQESQSFQAAVDLALPWLAHVHVNDANRHAPGEGDTDFVPIIRKLKSVGYAGFLSIEAFAFAQDPAIVLPRSRAYLEGILAAA
ncbi:MAG: sugar phosphate isomerase/epimerase [Chloroflexota bacterium]|nr:sugar phosphate isomerase/epimerase [Chloroflexota bacterium]